MNDVFCRIGYIYLILYFISILTDQCAAQSTITDRQFTRAIEDNSFFVEEAFNQEEGVVQHIFNGMYFKKPLDESFLSFTEEWPLFGSRHQLSVTVPYLFINSNRVNGFSDVMINYRYQLFTDQHWLSFAPRISLILPTGNSDKSLGFGTVGAQFNLPMSKRLSNPFIIHLNAAWTLLPNAKNMTFSGERVKHTLSWYAFAGSIIWLLHSNFNFMLEGVANFSSEINDVGAVVPNTEFILSPAIRFAINMHDLQIVPGFAVPFSFSKGDRRMGIFGYLSFEHPF